MIVYVGPTPDEKTKPAQLKWSSLWHGQRLQQSADPQIANRLPVWTTTLNGSSFFPSLASLGQVPHFSEQTTSHHRFVDCRRVGRYASPREWESPTLEQYQLNAFRLGSVPSVIAIWRGVGHNCMWDDKNPNSWEMLWTVTHGSCPEGFMPTKFTLNIIKLHSFSGSAQIDSWAYVGQVWPNVPQTKTGSLRKCHTIFMAA